MRSFGTYVTYYMKVNGVTTDDLAKRTGLRASYISRLISGAARPSVQTVQKIAQVIRFPAERLAEQLDCDKYERLLELIPIAPDSAITWARWDELTQGQRDEIRYQVARMAYRNRRRRKNRKRGGFRSRLLEAMLDRQAAMRARKRQDS